MADRKLPNWLQGYKEYTEGTESPPLFHLWVAIGTLAGAAQRKIFMDCDYYKVHCNNYIVLVSPPGRSRKSTALRIGQGFLSGLLEYGSEINFSTQASTVAALVQQFTGIQNKEHQSLTCYSSELGSLLGSKSVEMTDFLTDIYDAAPGWDKQTVARSMEKITFPWFNLVAATTPQWMGDNLSKTAVEGGFIRRTLFIYEDTRLRVAFPELTANQKVIKKYLLQDLAHISRLRGEFKFTPESREFYRHWYEDENDPGAFTNHRVSGYYECKQTHVLKIAMMLSLAEKDQLVLETRDIQTAINLLEEIEPGMKRSFAAVGKNEFSVVQDKVVTMIRQRGRMTYKEIVGICNNDIQSRRQIDDLIDTLVVLDEIELAGDGGTRSFVPGNRNNGK